MEIRRDNIYIYLWEELNTVYVGRTINPKSRHYTHKHRESEKTYKFSSEHGVEHPKMIIIENDLTIEEGVEREKYWIDYYKTNSAYNVLNITCGGQKGRQKNILTEEEKLKQRKEYYQKNKEKILAYSKLYRKNNAEKIKEKQHSYYKLHKKPHIVKTKEEIKLQQKKYRESHKEEINLKKKAYRETHREEIKLQQKKYRESHKEKIKQYEISRKEKLKKYYQDNKKHIKESQKKYREKIKSINII